MKCECELASKRFEHAFGVILPQMRQQFGIATSPEFVASPLQLRFALGKIKQLPVEYDMHAAIFVRNRLLPIRKADNAQPPGAETQTRS